MARELRFVKGGTPTEDAVNMLIERVIDCERSIGTLQRANADLQKRLFMPGAGCRVYAREASSSFFVRLYVREDAWRAAVVSPDTEDAADGALVKKVFDAVTAASGDVGMHFNFVSHVPLDAAGSPTDLRCGFGESVSHRALPVEIRARGSLPSAQARRGEVLSRVAHGFRRARGIGLRHGMGGAVVGVYGTGPLCSCTAQLRAALPLDLCDRMRPGCGRGVAAGLVEEVHERLGGAVRQARAACRAHTGRCHRGRSCRSFQDGGQTRLSAADVPRSG